MKKVVRRVLLATLVAGGVFGCWLVFVWPPPVWYATHWPRRTAFMTMRERQYARADSAVRKRYDPVLLSAMSPWLARAALAGEDEAFYQHHGIDWHAIRDALGYRRAEFDVMNPRDRAEMERALARAAARRDKLRGASTITQQLAKNLYLSPSRNPLRKLKEAVIAYQLEWSLSKDRILALYLNVAEFGPNLWGVEAASQRYFRKDAARLTMEQAATLIATLPHPLTSNPAFRPGRTRWRAALILRKLRGEDVEVPQEAPEEDVPAPADTTRQAPDTLPPDTSSLKPDTLPRDTAAAVPSRPA